VMETDGLGNLGPSIAVVGMWGPQLHVLAMMAMETSQTSQTLFHDLATVTAQTFQPRPPPPPVVVLGA